jgi:hypothetical protein
MSPQNTSSASESNLWRGRHRPTARHGHPGQPHCTSFTLAKRLCRNGWRIDPERVFGHTIVLGEAHLRRILKFMPTITSVSEPIDL